MLHVQNRDQQVDCHATSVKFHFDQRGIFHNKPIRSAMLMALNVIEEVYILEMRMLRENEKNRIRNEKI